MRHKKLNGITSFVSACVVLCLSLAILITFVYANVVKYPFPNYVYICLIVSGLILLVGSLIEFYRFLYLSKRKVAAIPAERRGELNEKRHVQMRMLGEILSVRANSLLYESNQQEDIQPDF